MSNKIGDIVENYQGQFAKVIRFTDGGITHLSAWVRTPKLAEEEVVSTSYLNEFGLSQVLKGGENVESIPSRASTKENTVAVADMSFDELRAYAKELGISDKGKKAVLAQAITAELQRMLEEEMVDHVITQEDLDNNPELAEDGVKVGDTILLPKSAE